MDTGCGKTLTALSYIRRFLDSSTVDVRYVLWVAPAELVAPTAGQLRMRWEAPVHVLPDDGCPREACTNVVRHDLLRKVNAELAAAAPRMITAFDEVDTMRAATQRAFAAHRFGALPQARVPDRDAPAQHEERAAGGMAK